MVKNCCKEKSRISGFNDSILMGLGQTQHQHPAVHTGGAYRGGSVAVAVAISDMLPYVDRLHMTHKTRHMTHDT